MEWSQHRNYWLLVADDGKTILDEIRIEYTTHTYTLKSNMVKYSSLQDAKIAAEALHS